MRLLSALISILLSFSCTAVLLVGVSSTVLGLTGCEEKPKTEEAAAEGEEEEGEGEEGEETEEVAAPKPVLKPLTDTEISLVTSDGITLKGWLSDPWQLSHPRKPTPVLTEEEIEAAAEEAEEGEEVAPPNPYIHLIEAPSKTYPVVILLHDLGRRHTSWTPLDKELVEQGYAVLNLDLRGHGASITKGKKGVVSWRNFSETDWKELSKDINRWMRFLKEQQSGKNTPDGVKLFNHLDLSRVVLLGASIGGNVALIHATQYEGVGGVGMISPGMDYKGLKTLMPASDYRGSLFLTASQEDVASFNTADKLFHVSQGVKVLKLYENTGHGTDMVTNHPPLRTAIIEWLSTLYPIVVPKPEEVKPAPPIKKPVKARIHRRVVKPKPKPDRPSGPPTPGEG